MVLVKLASDISLPLLPALVSMLSLAALKPNSTKCSNWSKEEASHTGVKMSKGPADTSKCLNLIMLAAVSQDLDTNCRLSSFPSLPCIKSIRCPIFQLAFQLTLTLIVALHLCDMATAKFFLPVKLASLSNHYSVFRRNW